MAGTLVAGYKEVRRACSQDMLRRGCPPADKKVLPGKPALFSLIAPSTGSPMETPIGEMMARMTIPVNILGARVNSAARPIPASGPGNVATRQEMIPGLNAVVQPFLQGCERGPPFQE